MPKTTITGTITDDGILEFQEPLTLPVGPVKVTVETIEPAPSARLQSQRLPGGILALDANDFLGNPSRQPGRPQPPIPAANQRLPQEIVTGDEDDHV